MDYDLTKVGIVEEVVFIVDIRNNEKYRLLAINKAQGAYKFACWDNKNNRCYNIFDLPEVKLYKEPKIVPMTNEEALQVIVDNPGIWVREKNDSDWYKIMRWSKGPHAEVYVLSDDGEALAMYYSELEYTTNFKDIFTFTKEV